MELIDLVNYDLAGTGILLIIYELSHRAMPEQVVLRSKISNISFNNIAKIRLGGTFILPAILFFSLAWFFGGFLDFINNGPPSKITFYLTAISTLLSSLSLLTFTIIQILFRFQGKIIDL